MIQNFAKIYVMTLVSVLKLLISIKYRLRQVNKVFLFFMCLSLVSISLLPGCAETSVEEGSADTKTNESIAQDRELSRRLDQVGTLEVAQCLVLVEVTVATAGNSAKIISALGKIGRGLAAVDDAVTLTVKGWIAAAGVESGAASGVSWLLVKAAELAGLPTAGDFAKSTILLLVNTALKLANSCLLVAQTYWDGIKSLPYVFGYEPDVNGCLNYDGWIECQKTCGVSLSEQDQLRVWSVPNECRFEPMQASIRQAYINGYLRYCLDQMCRQGRTAPASFNSCTWMGENEERDLITGWPPLEQRCQDASEVASYLEENTTTGPDVNRPSNNSNSSSNQTMPDPMSNNTPINSCTELFQCEQDCVQRGSDQSCTTDCYQRVSNTQIISLVNQLYSCAASYQCSDFACLEQNCEPFYLACGFERSLSNNNQNNNNQNNAGEEVPPDPPMGGNQMGGSQMAGNNNQNTLACGDIWDCLVECPDQGCVDLCISLGDNQAQQDILFLLDCYYFNESFIADYDDLYTYCPDESFTCFN